MGDIQPPSAIDLSHHINAHSKARYPSVLKDILKYMGYEGMISMAGGLPHHSLFPFQNLSISAYPAATVLDAANPNQVPSNLETLSIAKDLQGNQAQCLATALQYGGGTGNAGLLKWVHDFTKKVFEPARDDIEVLMNLGNTDGWNKVVGLLCERDEFILCEEYTYPSAQALWVPMGCQAVPVKMDGNGMRADDLETTLAGWDVSHPGVKRPHVMYIVPIGSNPTGSTMNGQRKKEIYDICVKFDVIICEDDPYYFLQYPEYKFPPTPSPIEKTSPEQYLLSLEPSFLKFDYQGRVIRLDTFSKTLAPGNRLGYFVASPPFIERLLRATEVETQAPSGWSQAIVLELLTKWGTDGFATWLSNLRDQYTARRDWMCNAIATKFQVSPASDISTSSLPHLADAEGLVVMAKGIPLFSFVPPRGGMFIWARFYLKDCPLYAKLQADESVEDPEQACEDAIWLAMVEEKILLTRGSYYVPWLGSDKMTTKSRVDQSGVCHFRLAFSMTTEEEMQQGIERIATTVERIWEL